MTRGLSDKLVKAYFDYMVDISVLFGADRTRALKELEESLDFEIKLANVSYQEISDEDRSIDSFRSHYQAKREGMRLFYTIQ